MSTDNNLDPPPNRKRRRPPVVCTECRRRKAACNLKMPCAQCTQYDLTCVYQSNTSAPRRSAPGLSATTSASTIINNIPSEAPSNLVTAVNVASPHAQVVPAVGPQQSVSLGFIPDASVEGTLDTATRPLSEDSLIPPVTVPSRTLRTSDKNEDSSRPHQHTRAWINPDGSLVSSDQSSRDQTNSFNGCYLKSRMFGQSHWMNSCFQVSVLSSSRLSIMLLT